MCRLGVRPIHQNQPYSATAAAEDSALVILLRLYEGSTAQPSNDIDENLACQIQKLVAVLRQKELLPADNPGGLRSPLMPFRGTLQLWKTRWCGGLPNRCSNTVVVTPDA